MSRKRLVGAVTLLGAAVGWCAISLSWTVDAPHEAALAQHGGDAAGGAHRTPPQRSRDPTQQQQQQAAAGDDDSESQDALGRLAAGGVAAEGQGQRLEHRALPEGGTPQGLPSVPRVGCVSGSRAPCSESAYCAWLNATIWEELQGSGSGSRRLLASGELKKLLLQHHAMHSAVAAGREPPGQRYVVWSLSGGVGNRMQALVSTFLTALLSGRVLLLKDWFAKTAKKGTPAPKEQSQAHPGLVMEVISQGGGGAAAHNEALLCSALPLMHLSDFRAMYPQHFATDMRGEHVKIDIISKHDPHYRHWSKLACADPSDFPNTQVKFSYIWTNQYYLPMFWANPTVRGRMERLFPNRDAFGPLSRFLIRPSLKVEVAVSRFLREKHAAAPDDTAADTPFRMQEQEQAGRAEGDGRTAVIGLQMRAFRIPRMVDMARDFEVCLLRQHPGGGQKLFMASLHKPIRDYYEQNHRTRILTLENHARGEQQTGSVEQDSEALADMLILGHTQDYLISPGSTFGSFVTGYFGRLPLQMHTMGNKGACSRLRTSQPCFMSLLKGDKILQKMRHFQCKPEGIPDEVTANCAPHLSIPFKKNA